MDTSIHHSADDAEHNNHPDPQTAQSADGERPPATCQYTWCAVPSDVLAAQLADSSFGSTIHAHTTSRPDAAVVVEASGLEVAGRVPPELIEVGVFVESCPQDLTPDQARAAAAALLDAPALLDGTIDRRVVLAMPSDVLAGLAPEQLEVVRSAALEAMTATADALRAGERVVSRGQFNRQVLDQLERMQGNLDSIEAALGEQTGTRS